MSTWTQKVAVSLDSAAVLVGPALVTTRLRLLSIVHIKRTRSGVIDATTTDNVVVAHSVPTKRTTTTIAPRVAHGYIKSISWGTSVDHGLDVVSRRHLILGRGKTRPTPIIRVSGVRLISGCPNRIGFPRSSTAIIVWCIPLQTLIATDSELGISMDNQLTSMNHTA